MQLIYDNLAAALIAGAIFLMLVAVNHRTQQAQVETSSFYAMRNMQIDFIEMLRRDMVGATRVEDTEEVEGMTDTTFTFYSRIGADTTERKVVYQRTRVGERGGHDLYRIQRYQEDNYGTMQEDGASMGTLTGWRIVGQNEQGNKPDSPADVRQIYIWFELVPPLAKEAEERRHWETTYRPEYMRSNTNL